MPNRTAARISTRDIATSAILLTFIMLFALVPMRLGPVDFAFLPLLAVFIGCQAVNWKVGLFLALSFGLASLTAAFIRPTVLSPMFYNPMVSIVPRICIGITTYFSYVGMRKLCVFAGNKLKKFDKRFNILISSSVSSVVGTLTNTALVLSMLAAFNFGKEISGIAIDGAFFAGIISLNFLVEVLVAAIVTPWIVLAVRRSQKLPEPEDALAEQK
jgi:uncharacterized membrane protein